MYLLLTESNLKKTNNRKKISQMFMVKIVLVLSKILNTLKSIFSVIFMSTLKLVTLSKNEPSNNGEFYRLCQNG